MEQDYDRVVIYDDWAGTNILNVYTGTSLPASVTSNTGTMLVQFLSDYGVNMQGFTASYTSVGSAYCSGTTTLNSTDWGNIHDGSGNNDYCNNMDCRWLIQPPQANSVTLSFTAFDLEPPSTDGQTIFDAVEVYDGTTTNAPLLGRFAGNSLPNSVTTSGGSMLVRFYSDMAVTHQGWSATYTSTTAPYCNGQTTLTAPSGNFSDGSGANQYANNSNCSWLIQPPGAASITLSFVSLSTEVNNDGVVVYDGTNNAAPVLGMYSGSNLPTSVTSTGGSMYVEFLSGATVRGDGWVANYTSICTPPNVPTFSPSSGCSPLTVTASSANCTGCTYQWSTGGGGTTATFTINTNYTVTVTNSFNCTASAAGTASITGQPTVSILPANAGFCTGGSVTLSTTPAGNGYVWSGPGGFSSNAATVNATTAGSYSVTVTNPGSCTGTATASLIVVQHSAPTANAGTDQVNTGGGVTIGGNPTATGGTSPYTYVWSPATGLNSAAVANPFANPSNTTTYYLTVTDSKGCTATDNVLVTVSNCFPTINPTQNVNVPSTGGSYSVSINATAGCNWNITGSCGWLSFNSAAGTGSATVTYTVSANTSTNTRTCVMTIGGNQFTITQNGATSCVPVANFSASTTTGTVPLSVNFFDSSTNSPQQWQWSFQGATPSSASVQNPTGITYSTPGIYNVGLTVFNTCGNDAETKSGFINVLATGLEETDNLKSFLVMPNPTKGEFVLSFETAVWQDVRVNVFNSVSQLVSSDVITTTGGLTQYKFDLSNNARGIYYLQLLCNGQSYYTKVLVE
jgi:hypothetical protein